MTNKEIVQALRICNRPKGHRCSECPIFSHYEHSKCKKAVDKSAADLIESLLDQLADSQQKERETAEERDHLRAELNEAEKLIPHICCYCKKNIVGSAAKFCKKQAEDGIHSGAYTCGEWEWCGKGAGNG